VAQDIDINIICKDGVKPLRILGRDENVSGQTVTTRFSQIYGNQQRYLTVELMIPEGVSGNQLSVADVEISYNDSASQQKLSHRNDVAVTYTDRKDVVEKSKNTGIYDNVSSYEANELSKKVVQLRDKGLLKEAKELQAENISNLSRQMSQSSSPQKLQEQLKQEESLLDSLDESDWNKYRKKAREKQHNIDTQKVKKRINS
jgi:Ca-activated chloride channel family protein